MATTFTRTVSALALSFAVLAGASACAIPEPTPTDAATGSPSTAPSATSTPEAPVDGLPVIRSCDELLSPSTIFAYNQNFVAEDAYTPLAGTKAREAVDLGGLVCAWVNQTSGEILTVAVANPTTAELEEVKAETASAKAAVTYEGYFTAGEDDALAQAFSNQCWIVVETDFAMGESEIEPFVTSVVTSLNS